MCVCVASCLSLLVCLYVTGGGQLANFLNFWIFKLSAVISQHVYENIFLSFNILLIPLCAVVAHTYDLHFEGVVSHH